MTTPTDHSKTLGIIHIAYGLFNVLMLIVAAIFIFGVLGFAALNSSGSDVAGIGLAGFIILVALGFSAILTLPEFVAGYALLKRKKWAKAAGVVSAILEAMSFPFGTALCVYTLWFLFSEQGKRIYDHQHALPPQPPQWGAISNHREVEYAPPVVPPDWR